MKRDTQTLGRLGLALILAGGLSVSIGRAAPITGDSQDVAKLLADARAESAELLYDASDMESFTRSNRSWESYAGAMTRIREHVNNTGKLTAKLRDAEPIASPWQKTAINRIESTLRELASNTEMTINYLNSNQMKVHTPEFNDYVKATYDLAQNLDSVVRDFVAYGEAKEKVDRLGKKLEITR